MQLPPGFRRRTWRRTDGTAVGRYYQRQMINGQRVEVTAGDLSTPVSDLWRMHDQSRERTLGWVLEQYMRYRAEDWSTAYRREASRMVDQLRDVTHLPMSKITNKFATDHCRHHRRTAPVAANRRMQLVRAAMLWATAEGHLPDATPVLRFVRNKEAHRQHWVSDADYTAIYARAHPILRLAMEFAYLAAMLRFEVCRLSKAHIQPDGLIVERVKGSRTSLTLWSPRLSAAVEAALALPGTSDWLLHYADGSPIEPAFLTRTFRLASVNGAVFHDLKRKAISDFAGDKLAKSGHRSPQMLRIYDVSNPRVAATA